jgi:hypothetical protein
MKKQLIKEAKRLQELAGITQHNENISDNNKEVWFFQPTDSGETVQSLITFDNGDVLDKPEVEYVASKKDVSLSSGLYGSIDFGDDGEDWYGEPNNEGSWDFWSFDGDQYYRGYEEDKDFVVIPKDKIQVLDQAYGDINNYLKNNDWKLETGTDEWMNLVELVGEENMSDYIRFLEDILKIKTF